MCIEGFLCVNDAWKGILVRVSNECTFVYKCVLCMYIGGAVTILDIPGGGNRVIKEF